MNIITEQQVRVSAIADDEQQLVIRAVAGDGEAFLLLTRRHGGHLYGTCFRILGNEALAKDAAQQALIDAWKSLAGFRSEAPFGAWLHRIGVRAALMVLRNEKRMGMRIEYTDDVSMTVDGMDRSNGSYADAGTAIDLEQAIARLAPQMRTVLVLHDIEGYRHEEIGTMLNIAPGTSKAHLHRARMLVKEWLQQ